MASKRIITICQSGGGFTTNPEDGSLHYTGGEAYALDLDENTELEDFKHELSETFQCNVDGITLKYFLPGNKKTLISISKDKDLKRMVNFFKDSDQVEVFIIAEDEVVARNVSNLPVSRSSRTTVSEAGVPPGGTDDLCGPHDLVFMEEPVDQSSLDICHSGNDEKHRRAATQWENTITGVDQRFSSFSEFREALHKYSIAHGFSYKYKKNDSHRVTVKCKVEGCPWRVYASKLATTQLICIKKMNDKHTCEGTTVKAGYRATKGWVGNIIKEKLKVSPHYKPKDIATDIKREYGIQLNYSQAWRAKEIAREQLQGSFKEAYCQLPYFCEKIIETNPGSIATFSTKEDSTFHRMFVAFHASLSGFKACRPLIFLDCTLLYSKYQGTLLGATAADGNDGVFPVAFAVVDEETDENWHWFLSELKSAVSTSRQITFVADLQKGISDSLRDVFGEDCYHAYCLRYLAEKLNRDLQGQFSHEARRLMVQDLSAAAFAPKLDAFERCAENIKAISPEAYNWVIQSGPKNWANALFGGARYNHMTSNFGQLFYNWVSEADELPITQMIDVLRGKMMELIYTRRVESSQWTTRLCPLMEEKLQNETSKAQSLQVLFLQGNTFQVTGESVDIVDIDHLDCSCKGWQLLGLPCCHAIAVLETVGRSPYDYCSTYFLAESYHATYAESINPIPNVEKPVKSELDVTGVTVTPPPTKRPPGRPKMKPVDSLDVMKRQLQCSKCKGLGHNKKTCNRLNGIKENEAIEKEATETPLLMSLPSEEPVGST
ncbi:OLC1v1012029C1 [Oldenlandia corymbosa var. corymbosa]|uniref:OLC1v1012029C1 n=1 Tax=Oldenlandia corymbosa var. corymbosa TaxID=529605 RepID=A0AAV1DY85_OLDCO|nr:OLC1v1012029C1 [Oldenlandia corymbosa var. corymbosa]